MAIRRTPIKKRKRPPKDVRDEILRRSRRHCCMCFGLKSILESVEGQIAHLDRDRSNFQIDNLAYLCLECHKNYDSKSNRVQSYTPGEISHYRSLLYRALRHDQIEWTLTVRADRSSYIAIKEAVLRAHAILRENTVEVTFSEAPLE